MSQHPSLRSLDKGKQHRSVLKRYEKIKILKEKEKWDDKDSVFGLAKVKVVRFKVKKEKAAVAEGAEAVSADAAAAPAAPATKGQAPQAKGAAKAAPAAPAAKGSGKAAPESKKGPAPS